MNFIRIGILALWVVCAGKVAGYTLEAYKKTAP